MATEVLVPPLGQTVDTVVLVTWYKNEGERVAQGDPLFAIETDKATLDVEAPASGVLRQVMAQPGDVVKALSAIGLIAAADEVVTGEEKAGRVIDAQPLPARPDPGDRDGIREIPGTGSGRDRDGIRDAAKRPEWGAQPGQAAPSPQPPAPSPQPPGNRIFISPRARRLAKEHNIPLTALPATGPEGAIIERDVRAYLDAQAVPAITPVARRMAEEAGLDWHSLPGSGPGGRITRNDVAQALQMAQAVREAVPPPTVDNEVIEAIPVHSVRAVIAERMARSATTTAHVTLTAEADATALVELRRQLIRDGVSVSYNDLFLYILGRALREHPQLNASLEGDSIQLWRRIHIGLAVDTDRGLLVPVVRDVDRKGLIELGHATQAFIERAQAGQCTPDELSGGTFTLTNLGMFGIDAFTPIINLPECAILGVGRIKRRPVMIEDQVVGRQMVWLSLTFDHRLVDGGPAARFLRRVVQLVEGPHLLIA
jgi:pyruvate dehydrogenase E2 component (dihydrolipoamide acetyltransferase)